MYKVVHILISLFVLSACTSVPSREEFVSNYKIAAHSDNTLTIRVITGKVLYGPGKPKWKFRRVEQMQFAEDLARVLNENRVFREITLLREPKDSVNSDFVIDLRFHSTEHYFDTWYYIIDFSMVILSSSGEVVYEKREKFQSNTTAEVLNYTESFANALVPAKYKAKEKLLNITVQGIEQWLGNK